MKTMNLMTPINPLGYGVAGLNIFKELVKNVDVSLFPIGQIEVDNQDNYMVCFPSFIPHAIKPVYTEDNKDVPCLYKIFIHEK